jgi:Flp pilus assembly protein TadD
VGDGPLTVPVAAGRWTGGGETFGRVGGRGRETPPSTAEAALRSLVKYYPDDASGHHNLGTLLLQFKRYDEAVRSLRQALRHRADAPATYLHLGFALKESGRIDEAVAAWQQVLRLAPNDPTARAELNQAALSASRTNVELSLRR